MLVKVTTWAKDSFGLFDYAAKETSVDHFSSKTSSEIARIEEKVVLQDLGVYES